MHSLLTLTLLLPPFVCGSIPTSPADTHEPTPREQVLAVLDDMTKAVLAGDKDAYLKHVSKSNACFAMEQQHWADELAANKPLEFSISMDESSAIKKQATGKFGTLIFTDTRAEFPMVMKYKMAVGHAKTARGKTAVWPAVFVKEDPDGEGPLPSQWLYQGENWQSLTGDWTADHSGGVFTVKYFPGSEPVAHDVLQAFPPAKRHADEGFGVNITRPLEIKLFDNMEHLKASVYLNMPDEILGGWTEPGEAIKFMTSYTQTVPRWTAAFAHEYGHTATWELGPKIKQSPWWVQEGVAELCAEEFTLDRDSIDKQMRFRATKQGKSGLQKWDDLADYQKADPDIKQLAYYQGHHFMGWFSEQWGRTGRNAWLRAIAHGKTLDEASKEVTTYTFDELDMRWRASLSPTIEKTVIEKNKR